MVRRGVATGLVVLGGLTSAGAAGPDPEAAQALEAEVLKRTNAARTTRGLRALEPSTVLSRLARGHSCEMAREGLLGHRSPERGGLGERMRRAGVAFARVAENLAYVAGLDPVDTAVRGWLDSAGHRANLLDDRFTETGVGVCRAGERYYLTQLFVRRHDAGAIPGASGSARARPAVRGQLESRRPAVTPPGACGRVAAIPS